MFLLLACNPTTIDVQDDLPVGESGTFSLSFDHNDVTRESVVHVPEGIQAGAPVLLNFHGFGGNGLGHMEWADFRELADAQGFIVAHRDESKSSGAQRRRLLELTQDGRNYVGRVKGEF